MLGKNAQVVIGIAIVILSAAFLLVGIFYAYAQGVFFQNGVVYMQLFANNIEAAKNALYEAPSSMSIVLAGNTSLCSWQKNIASYVCQGGSKITALSYASGPTLDVGTNYFTSAMCVMVALGPPGSGKAKDAQEAMTQTLKEGAGFVAYNAKSEGLQIMKGIIEDSNAYSEVLTTGKTELLSSVKLAPGEGATLSELAAKGEGLAFVGSDAESATHAIVLLQNGKTQIVPLTEFETEASAISEITANLKSKSLAGALKKDKNVFFVSARPILPSDISQVVKSRGNTLLAGIKNIVINGGKRSAKNIGKTLLYFGGGFIAGATISYFLGNDAQSADQNVSSATPVGVVTVPPPGPSTVSTATSTIASYESGQPIDGSNAAFNYEMQHYLGMQDLATTVGGIPDGEYKDLETNLAVNSLLGQQALLDDLNSVSSVYNTNPYDTPVSGVAVPTNPVTTSNSILGGTDLSSGGGNFSLDPPAAVGSLAQSANSSKPFGIISRFANAKYISAPRLAARAGLLTYAQDASCLGDIPATIKGITSGNVLTTANSLISIYGYLTTLADFYIKNNMVMQLGSYYVGYGGDVYVNGQSSGRPTGPVSSPVIIDQSDLCSLAETAPPPGQHLSEMIFPAGNGSLVFSIQQGLFNTQCDLNNALFPHTLADFVNSALNSNLNTVSILLPPQYAIGFDNNSKTTVCIYQMLLDSYGNPVSTSDSFSTFHLSRNLFSPSYSILFGAPVSCINVSALTGNKYNLLFFNGINGNTITKVSSTSGAANTNPYTGPLVDGNEFFINNESQYAFSIPTSVYSTSTGNFVSGASPSSNISVGFDSPVVSFWGSVLFHTEPKLETSLQPLINEFEQALGLTQPQAPQISYHITDYTNVTFNIQRMFTSNGVESVNLTFDKNSMLFGVYPNTPSATMESFSWVTLQASGGSVT